MSFAITNCGIWVSDGVESVAGDDDVGIEGGVRVGMFGLFMRNGFLALLQAIYSLCCSGQ